MLHFSKTHLTLEKALTLIAKEEDKEEHIVYGIVYEPDVVDAQGDIANAEEIRKACYSFMENSQVFKVSHRSKNLKIRVLENYLAPDDFIIEERPVKKGTWILAIRVLDALVWEKIKRGELEGYSMVGVARERDLTKSHRDNGVPVLQPVASQLMKAVQTLENLIPTLRERKQIVAKIENIEKRMEVIESNIDESQIIVEQDDENSDTLDEFPSLDPLLG